MPVRFQSAILVSAVFVATALTSIAATTSAIAADAAYGEYLSSECITCHRRDGENKGIPSITGWPRDKFIATLKAFKTKDRPNQIMQTVASRLSDDDMAALATFYGSLKLSQ